MPGVLTVQFDHAQPRISADRLPIVAAGEDWENSNSTGTWVEPITNRVILRPYALTDAWYTTGSGDYAKLAKSDFGLGSDFEDRADQGAKGNWIAKKDSSTAMASPAISTTTYSKNRGFYCSWFSYNSGQRFLQYQCGWQNSGTATSGVRFDFYSDGNVEAFKDNVLIKTGSISGSASGAASENAVFDVVLIPYAHDEILVWSPLRGAGFNVVLEDIDPEDANPTIVAASKFWWLVPNGAVQVQVAPIKFPSSGTVLSRKTALIEPPATGEALANFTYSGWPGGTHAYAISGHQAFVGTQGASAALYEHDGTTAFVPNSSRVKCRIKLTLTTSDQGYTPCVYFAQLVYPQQVGTTDDSEQYDATNYVKSASLSVPDDPRGVTLDLEFRAPETLSGLVASLSDQTNRPMLAKLGSKKLLDGVSGETSTHIALTDGASSCSFAVHDRTKLLENYVFTDRVPLGGMLLTDALQFIVRRAGIDYADMNITSSSFAIPYGSGGDASNLGLSIEPGDNALDWVGRLIETFAADWTWGFRPTASGDEFFALDDAGLGTSPIIKVYETTADAIADGVDPADAPHLLVRRLQRERLEPLANDVRVTGLDARTGRPVQAWKEDAGSKDPTTVPSSRPANWLGYIKRYALIEPGLRSQSAVNWACDTIAARVTEAPEVIQFDSSLLTVGDVAIWRGDPIRVYGRGIYRVMSLHCAFLREVSAVQSRDAQYVAKRIGDEPA